MPAASTRTSTSPSPGCGSGAARSCRTSGPPWRSKTTARMVLISPLRQGGPMVGGAGTRTPHELELLERQPARDEGRAPVLFVHGLGHGAWCWEHWLEGTAEAGHPAYAVSLRGH